MFGARGVASGVMVACAALAGAGILHAAQAGHEDPARPAADSAAREASADRPGAGLVSVHDFARQLGLETSWLEPGKQLSLASRWTNLVFTAERREVLLNGVRVFMGEGAAAAGPTLRISSIDRDRLLRPILLPQGNDVRAPVQTIALDPGHGGSDRGARNDDLKLLEKVLTLDLARRLGARLEAAGFCVVLTREEDTYVPLPERPARAALAGADLFVSLHFNAAGSTDVRGLETYVLTPQYQRSTGSEEKRADDAIPVPGNRFDGWSSYLGYTLHGILLQQLELPDRGLKRARFAVLRDLPCPGLLVEGGYLSNADDAELIKTEAYRDALAAALASGIDVYCQTLRRLEAMRPAVAAEES